MSKISTVNPGRNPNISTASAWARGPPPSSTPSAASNQPPSSAVASVSATPAPAVPRPTNGQPSHSRRSSAAFPSTNQPPPTTLKDPVAVSKSAAAPISAMASNLTFGTVDDSNAILSTSPAAPSTIADVAQIKSFGSIAAASTQPSSVSPAVAKVNPPARTDSPAPAGKIKKKLDVNSLFQKPQANPAPAQPAAPAPTPTAQQPVQPHVAPNPIPPQQEGPSVRPPPKHQASFDSPSMRNSPLPILSHPPNQTPSPLQPGAGAPSYHFNPSQSHLRQGGNGAPGFNPPRSPNLSRAMTNGNMRGPPGGPVSGALGSPRMGHPPATPTPSTPAPSQTPIPGAPPGMMNMPGGPPHMASPVTPLQQGQMPPHQMGMPPPMWGYYYPQYYDPNMPPQGYHWGAHPSHMPPHMVSQPHAPPPQQQTPLPMPQSNLATPTQAPMAMPMSPRVLPGNIPAPQTPSTPLTQPGNRASFIAKRPIMIKNAAGEEIDLHKLRGEKHEDGAVATPSKEEAPRRPVSVRLETEDAFKKRIEEEKLRDKDRVKRDEEMAKRKAQRDAEAKERAKRDAEEKERRKREQEEAEKKKLDDEQRAKLDAEEAEQREKDKLKRDEEERLRKIQEEEERKRHEAEEKEKARLAEIEAKRLAEEETKRKAEEETKRAAEEQAKRLAEEEAKRKAEEERKKKEEEEAAKRKEEEEAKLKEEEEAKLKAEAEQKAKQEEEAKQKEEQDISSASNTAPAQPIDSASQSSTPLGSTPAYASPAHSTRDLPKSASALPPSLDPKQKRPIPGRLDLSGTSNANLPQPLPSALASARIIEDIGKVSYPEGIKAPSSELNVNAANGKFRYDRDFLMQFMKVCKEKPDDMPSLDAIGLEPSEQQGQFATRRGRPPMSGAPASNRNSMGLGLTGPGGAPFGGKSFGGGGMGQFQAPAGRSSEERFAASSMPRTVSGSVPFPRQALGRTNSGSGPQLQAGRRGDVPQRTHSGRGTKRTDSKAPPPSSGMQSFTAPEPELHQADNAWSGAQRKGQVDQSSTEYIDRKVKGLLNKLTMEKFDSISQQILEWANRSVNESDGRTLIQVIKLVFEKATDEATWSEMYARLCRFLMERISQDVRDEGIKNADGKPIAGGNLFRKYLLNRCQEDFERGWSAREAAMQAAAGKAEDDKAAAAAAEKAGTGEEVLYSDEYYASQKAKRRGLGLVKFIGELFKLQMLTERIMHECIKKLLSNVENPEEEEIESLCKLLATVGQALDTPKARNHMDIYFSRMQELANSGQISSRIQFMLIDIIELRSRKWVTRTQVAAPSTIAEVHQKAERDRQVAEREAALRQAGGRDHMRTGRRDTRDPSQVGPDGWTTPARPPAKAGDLSRFGKISKSTTMQFGPSSVFSKNDKRESTSVTRASSSSNMFAALNSNEATPDAVSVGSRTANSTRPPSRKGSVDFSVGSVADGRRKLLLHPRTQAVPSETGSFRDDAGSAIGQSEQGDDDVASVATSAAPVGMTSEQAKRKIKEDLKELFMLRQPSEAEGYFSSLPPEFRWQLVEELVSKAIDVKPTDVQLIADVFTVAASKGLVDEAQFSQGFAKDMEYLEDTSTDSPNAYSNIANLLKAANLSQATVDSLADKIIVEGEMAITPKEKLLKKYAALTT